MQRITALKRVWLIDVLKSSVSLAQKVGAWHCGFLSKQKIEVQPVSSNYMILIDKFLFAKDVEKLFLELRIFYPYAVKYEKVKGYCAMQ